MRRVLTALVLVECVLLVGGAFAFGLHGHRFRKPAPAPPVFTPPIYDAVIGDLVRYRRVDPDDENVELGYVDYVIRHARVLENTGLGAEINLEIHERDADGTERRRVVRVQPRLLDHGFLPQTFRELDRLDVPGARPVIRSIRTAEVPGGEGFVIETVTPRESLRDVTGRLYVRPGVPIFGVVRWERGDETWILHYHERAERRDGEEVE